jgi:hypothetical protein
MSPQRHRHLKMLLLQLTPIHVLLALVRVHNVALIQIVPCFAKPSTPPVGCCGGSTTSSGCCQNQQNVGRTTRSTRVTATSTSSDSITANDPNITLTCADAYTTLSRHPGYERASGDIASWMPKLDAHSVATPEKLEGRPAMEIDAANVMSVLKDFDRRFA